MTVLYTGDCSHYEITPSYSLVDCCISGDVWTVSGDCWYEVSSVTGVCHPSGLDAAPLIDNGAQV